MRRFKNILFFANPLDGAESALRQALSLSELNGARITLIEVAREMSVSFVEAGIVSDTLREEILAERRARAEALVESLDGSNSIEVKLLTGTPFIEVIQEVIRGNYDLLIKPTDGGSKFSRLLGSNDMHLLRKCPCPVWVVKPTRAHMHKKILAAVDPEPTDTNADLNRLILELASSLSAHHSADLHIVAAWDLWGQYTLRPRQLRAELDHLRQDAEKANQRWLDELTSPFETDGLKLHTHLLEGRVSEVILKEAKKRDVDLIVMGTVGRVGIPGYFIGNNAERILGDADRSILAVKPPGFRSPVTV